MNRTIRRKLAIAVLPVALLVAACGNDDDGDAADTGTGTETTQTTMVDDGTGTTMDDDMAAPQGAACEAVPAEGAGSFDGMAQDPVATAASNNPELSTLVTAVTEAGLVDTLNGEGPFTIFAPINAAFEEIPEEDLQALLADQEQLTEVLTFHVLAERVQPDELSGTYETVAGEEIEISGSAPSFDVDGQATVVCSGIQTSNATVYLIDSVLMPGM
jgi:uncharacterized surface protein with fasciclin (FAS1) repeats